MGSVKLIHLLEKHQPHFHQVVAFDTEKDKLAALDLTASNTSLTEEILNDTGAFTAYINQQLKKNNARYGIGGYAENRAVYAVSNVFDAPHPGEMPRRLHLGIDIWGKPNTAVMAPTPGIIHSFAYNDRRGDYGATIILTHKIEDHSYYTLYGHLSLNSIKNIREGDNIKKAEIFAEFGIRSENGQWPPHLHFQLITDMGEWKGDYPGVCAVEEKEKWLNNSPDPDIILQLNKFL